MFKDWFFPAPLLVPTTPLAMEQPNGMEGTETQHCFQADCKILENVTIGSCECECVHGHFAPLSTPAIEILD